METLTIMQWCTITTVGTTITTTIINNTAITLTSINNKPTHLQPTSEKPNKFSNKTNQKISSFKMKFNNNSNKDFDQEETQLQEIIQEQKITLTSHRIKQSAIHNSTTIHSINKTITSYKTTEQIKTLTSTISINQTKKSMVKITHSISRINSF